MIEPRCSSQGRSSRIYKIGQKNRKKFDRDEESYLLSRILNQQDYSSIPIKVSKLKFDINQSPLQLPPPLPRRLSYKKHQKSKSQTPQSSFRQHSHSPFKSQYQTKTLKLFQLGDVKYLTYRVDPLLIALKTPLRKYRRNKSIIYS